ncbi:MULTISPECIES: hypothetical protein [unclassified Pseudovibrio]|uniref:hypothetical protein n=1 Tax=unclassified Pseudovibrio TaxID=2627060 RepID=UPI0009EF1C16|nr:MULTISPECIES: hypothetical protein [unclassified Pseudovibrio]
MADNNITPTLGAFDLGEGLTPVDIWQGLHASEPLWMASAGIEGGDENQSRIDETDLSLLGQGQDRSKIVR